MNAYTEEQQETLGEVLYRADAWFEGAGYDVATQEQVDCLKDPQRAEEARGMLEHWVARTGLPERIVAPALKVIGGVA